MRTIPEDRVIRPVETIRVEVVAGPDKGRSLTTNSLEPVAIGTAQGNALILTDTTVSRYHVELRRAEAGVEVRDLGSTNSTLAGPVSIKHAVVALGTRLEIGRSTIMLQSGDPVQLTLHDAESFGKLRGRSTKVRALMSKIERVAPSQVSVLLIGETGVGKELFATALHEASARAGGPLEIVDCGALSPTLVASELFGHDKGAFTGADQQHIGAFERADGGTLFLDEIGELPQQLQASLLGALERRSFRRVGGKNPIQVDVRVVCATNRDLREEVNAGSFREDLYYRISVVTLEIPPLRDRRDDIPILIEHFLREAGFSGPLGDIFSARVLDQMAQYRWPGNVRELRNFVEAAIAMGEAPLLPKPVSAETRSQDELLGLQFKDARAIVLDEFERTYLAHLLEATNGNVSKAARKSGIHRSYLNVMLRRHDLR